MPLNPSDPAYIAEVTPASIAAMEHPLCNAYGVGLDAFGAKGNTVHLSGYHRSRQWILSSRDSRYGSSDYSVTQTLDKSGDWHWVSAFDFTPASWGTPDNRAKMRQITGRVHAAAQARDPRLASLREFAGTLDGINVVTFNCSDGSPRTPFDRSHLDHCHGSFWRSRAANDHAGIVAVMLGTPTVAPREDDVNALIRYAEHPAVFVTDGRTARWVENEHTLLDFQQLHNEGTLPLGYAGQVRVVGNASLIGTVVGAVPDGWPPPVVVGPLPLP